MFISKERREKMKNPITDISPRTAARTVGIAFIISFFFAILVGDFLLPNFIVPGGDAAALANDIEANESLFIMAVVGYLIILTLDIVIGLALYVVLKPANRILAFLSGSLRILYVAFMAIGVLALAFQFIDVYSYGTLKLIGYLFFTCHILVTGYTVFRSGYIPRILGVLLMIAFISYIFAFYVNFLVPKAILIIFMLFMIIGELSLSLWLIFKGNKIPEEGKS